MLFELRSVPSDAGDVRVDPARPKALIASSASADLHVVIAALGDGWDVATTARAADVEAIDPKVRLVLLDDRIPGSIIALVRTALDRAHVVVGEHVPHERLDGLAARHRSLPDGSRGFGAPGSASPDGAARGTDDATEAYGHA
jgi:hypothetical protein